MHILLADFITYSIPFTSFTKGTSRSLSILLNYTNLLYTIISVPFTV